VPSRSKTDLNSAVATAEDVCIGLNLLDRKIILATEGFMTKFSESTLRDRSKLSQENALVVAEYIISMKREVNPRLSYIKYTIQFLSELSRAI